MQKVELITPFTWDASKYPGTSFIPKDANDPDDPCVSRTDPQYRDESDPNVIVERFLKTGDINELVQKNRAEGMQGDFSEAKDYFSAMCLVRDVELAFLAYPYKTREKFDHDPKKMLDFINDPKNEDECVELKLFTPETIERITKAKIEAAKAAEIAAGAAPAAQGAPAPKPA